uniref:putative disease resistance RPP13-like protein 1 n=1 Tax=Erigeron canadensis TaxID=72917 RepID=UPI001CB8EB91|nr:putative disease resistance RPP13-like protein 1 [Erigeron canadensis]
MAIAEVIVGAFVTVLFEKLASDDLIMLARSAGIYSELNKWNDKLLQIQAVLVDASHKHLRQASVQLWLNKLQHLAYDIDDVLDDLTTEAARRHMNEESYASTSTSKVLKIIPTKFHAYKYGRKMGSKLYKITTKLHDLVEEKNLLGLTDNVGRSSSTVKRLEETSLVDVPSIVGREGDKELLLGKLLGNESCSRNFSVVSIVGLGGIGKTTLTQVLYNDKEVKDHFELKSWVCVSDELDVFSISMAIFIDVGGVDTNFKTLNQLQVALSEKLSKKRFLLVLDDVWNEDSNQWELLQRPFSVAAPGSKIIVTTRKKKVATVVDSTQAYPLEILSNEEALCLLAQNALGKENFDSHPTFKLHGEGIVNKCGRLPLALITIGRVLRSKTNYEEWEELLNSEIWNLLNEGNILPALRLSYYDLPPHLKQMFAYCCLFPKDYVFDIDELVLLWMAEGFLHGSNCNISMEKFGHQCFRELESRSFFQHCSSDKSRYTMHDLISDLAMNVAGDFFYALGDKMGDDDGKEVLEKIHHFSFVRQQYGVYKTFKALQRARGLRTFLPMSVRIDRWQSFYLSSKVLSELLPQLQILRVLSLANYGIKVVPESIGSLKHLRYLNLSKTDITCLPEQVGNLCNLQSLLLFGCHRLSSLPHSLIKLINLRHLDINYTPELKELPFGIGELTGLQTLSKVIIGDANGFKISHLKDLPHLQGRLTIEGLHKVTDLTDAKEASLHQKKGLHDLEMDWGNVSDVSRNAFEVLEELRPFEKLSNIKISNYTGTKFPNWLGDPTYDCLTQIMLSGCRSCTCLPTLGHLPSLQKLFVESMNGLKRVGSELLGTASGDVFPSLKVLEFKNMDGWEEWLTVDGDGKDGIATSFPCLSRISIINCPKLDVLTIEPIHSLQDLHVEICSASVLRSMIGVSSRLTRLTVREVNGLTTQLDGDVLKNLRAVEYLSISRCDELTYLWESEDEACKILRNLQELEVEKCKNLVRLEEKKVDLMIRMESLRNVSLHGCERLENYHCGSDSIERLWISGCGSMKSLTFPARDDQDLPPTLKSLGICVWKNGDVNWFLSHFLSSLTSLRLTTLPNLRFLPEGCLLHLTKLSISKCENIESIPERGYGFLPHLCLRYLLIHNCENIKSFPHEQLPRLVSLEEMYIENCPSMDNSFPCGLWPPNLHKLVIGGLKKPMSEWGVQNFPNSLVSLSLHGENSGVVSFANTSSSSSMFLLPSSLTYLFMGDFKELETISSGMQHLTSLEILSIWKCRRLRDLPETLLPSLSSLQVLFPSHELRKKCSNARRRKGKYYSIISQIPYLETQESRMRRERSSDSKLFFWRRD